MHDPDRRRAGPFAWIRRNIFGRLARRYGLTFKPRENAYRDAVNLFAVLLAGLAVVVSNDGRSTAQTAAKNADKSAVVAATAARDAARAVSKQAEGRRIAVQIICGATSGVIEAGRATITGQTSAAFSPVFERNLERLGFPPKAQRESVARRQAVLYAKFIAKRVRDVADGRGRGIVRKDGSLNCDRLQRAARTSR